MGSPLDDDRYCQPNVREESPCVCGRFFLSTVIGMAPIRNPPLLRAFARNNLLAK